MTKMTLMKNFRNAVALAAVSSVLLATPMLAQKETGNVPETSAPAATGSSVRAIEANFAGSLQGSRVGTIERPFFWSMKPPAGEQIAQIQDMGPRPETMAPAAVATATTTFNGIAHIAVRVKDIATSVAFYNKLGFEQAFAMTAKDGSVSQSFIKINDRQFIELYPVSAANPQIGFLHLCFEGQDLNAIYADYVARGLTPNIAVRKAGAGNLLFTMKGPMQATDLQNIEYTQYMPGSLHTNDIGLHLGPARVADRMVEVVLAVQDPAAAKAFYRDKLLFKVDAKDDDDFVLPGASGQKVEIASLGKLGAKSSIEMSAPDMKIALTLLKKSGIPYVENGKKLHVVDPDGNSITIEAAK